MKTRFGFILPSLRRRSFFPAVFGLLVIGAAPRVVAQSSSAAAVTGVVLDQTGGGLVGAQVELVNAS